MPLYQLQFRRDSATDWEAENPVLLDGEMGIVTGGAAGEPITFKIGDGVTAWNDLSTVSGPPGPEGRQGDKGEQGDDGPRGQQGESGVMPPITDSVTSDASGVYASAKAVKTAYDKALEAATSTGAVAGHAALTDAHEATAEATPERLLLRDAAGRAKVAAPEAADDIARKAEADAVQGSLDTHANQYAPNKGISSHVRVQYANGAPTGGTEGMIWFQLV